MRSETTEMLARRKTEVFARVRNEQSGREAAKLQRWTRAANALTTVEERRLSAALGDLEFLGL